MTHVAARTVEAGGCQLPDTVWEEHTAEQTLRNIVVRPGPEQDVIKET